MGIGIGPSAAQAQEARVPEGGELPPYARVMPVPPGPGPVSRFTPVRNGLPTIMLTGYWPPTNEMLRQFSPNPVQNPDGWVGQNWEGRGYNVYAFFPEFPGGLGKGEGDFEVDYQDTSNDFWPLVATLEPIAIVSFGRAGADIDWELEGGNYRYTTTSYSADYLTPYRPTPELPFYNEPVNTFRVSTLPLAQIVAAVAACGANVNPYSTTYDESKFLCSYMGYHSNWYHELHADPEDPAWNICAGFIHLGSNLTLPDAILCSEVTLRTVIGHVDLQRPVPGDLDADRDVDYDDLTVLTDCLAGPQGAPGAGCTGADFDDDDDVDLADFAAFQKWFTGSS